MVVSFNQKVQVIFFKNKNIWFIKVPISSNATFFINLILILKASFKAVDCYIQSQDYNNVAWTDMPNNFLEDLRRRTLSVKKLLKLGLLKFSKNVSIKYANKPVILKKKSKYIYIKH